VARGTDKVSWQEFKQCVRVQCPSLPAVANSRWAKIQGYRYQDKATVDCNDKYLGEGTSECTSAGTWTTPPSCYKGQQHQVKNINGPGLECKEGFYNTTRGVIACFASGFDKALLQRIKSSVGIASSTCYPCDPLCVSCPVGGEPLTALGYNLAAGSMLDDGPDKLLFKCSAGKYSCPGGTSSSSTCAGNHTSTLCTKCNSDSSTMERRFFNDGKECMPCKEGSFSATTTIIVLLYAVLGVAAVVGPRKVQIIRSADIGFVRSSKIVISYFQVTGALGSVLGLDFKKLLPIWQWFISLSRVLFLQVQTIFNHAKCLNVNWFNIWLIKSAILPIVLVVICLLLYFCSKGAARDKRNAKTRITWLIFLLYPSCTHEIFKMFPCKATSETTSWLQTSMDLSCQSDKYSTYFSVALLLAVLIPIGIPVTLAVYFGLELRKNTETYKRMVVAHGDSALDQPSESSAHFNYEQLVRGFKGLIQDYKPQYFYFELVDFGRKAFFTGFLLFVPDSAQGSLKLVCGSSLAFLFLFHHVVVWPFERQSHNIMKSIELLCIFVTFQCATLLKAEDHNDAENFESDLDFIIDFTPVTSVGVLLVAFVFYTWKAVKESSHLSRSVGAPGKHIELKMTRVLSDDFEEDDCGDEEELHEDLGDLDNIDRPRSLSAAERVNVAAAENSRKKRNKRAKELREEREKASRSGSDSGSSTSSGQVEIELQGH